jgi:ubiquinone/menaquinone biosynthesis C-methylase UbiE
VERVRQAYGARAEQYIGRFGSSADVHADDLALIARHLSIRPGTVIDVGCGPGHLTAHLHSLNVDARGIDLVPEFIDHARASYPEGRFDLGSTDRLPVPDNSIAGILAWYSLIHVPPDDVDRFLDELRRAAAPGGMLVVGFFDSDHVMEFEHKVVAAYSWPIDEFSERLRHAGFVEVERQHRPGRAGDGIRSQAAIAATAV